MLQTLRDFIETMALAPLLNLKIEVGGYDLRYAVYLLVFLGILVAFEGLRQLLERAENREEAVNRRIRMLSKGKSGEDVLNLLAPDQSKSFTQSFPIVGNLDAALRAAGLTVPPLLFLAGCLAAFAVAAGGGAQIQEPLMAVSVSAVVFLILPLVVLRRIQTKRLATLVKQLPDALDLMSRGLKVGHPLNTTFQSVANEMPDPIGTEFGIVVDQIAFGEELTTAMQNFANRIDEENVRYLAIAVNMQHGSGGDLAQVLRILSKVIRARMTLRRKVKAISSEGRLTAYILSALPVAIAATMMIATPSYYGDVADYPSFWPVMSVIAVAVVFNAVILFRLVNFRV